MDTNHHPDEDIITRRFQLFKKQLKQYIERRIELSVIESGEQLSYLFANLAHQVSGLIITLCGVAFLLIAIALYLGELLQRPSLGFVIVSVPLFIIGALFIRMRPYSFTEKIRLSVLKEIMQIAELKERTNEQKRDEDQEKQKKSRT